MSYTRVIPEWALGSCLSWTTCQVGPRVEKVLWKQIPIIQWCCGFGMQEGKGSSLRSLWQSFDRHSRIRFDSGRISWSTKGLDISLVRGHISHERGREKEKGGGFVYILLHPLSFTKPWWHFGHLRIKASDICSKTSLTINSVSFGMFREKGDRADFWSQTDSFSHGVHRVGLCVFILSFFTCLGYMIRFLTLPTRLFQTFLTIPQQTTW